MHRDVLYLTVIGDSQEDWDLLLGTLENRLAGGARCLLWLTGERPLAYRLPSAVATVRRPFYGATPAFNYAMALSDAVAWAEQETDARVMVRLDADEYFPRAGACAIAAAREGCCARVSLFHHLNPWWGVLVDGQTRIAVWPLRSTPVRHKPSDMGPFHPILDDPSPPEVLMDGIRLQHVRFAIGSKAGERPEYWITDEWRGGRVLSVRDPWPSKLVAWREEARRPSADYMRRIEAAEVGRG